jgi:hypothetical protein
VHVVLSGFSSLGLVREKSTGICPAPHGCGGIVAPQRPGRNPKLDQSHVLHLTTERLFRWMLYRTMKSLPASDIQHNGELSHPALLKAVLVFIDVVWILMFCLRLLIFFNHITISSYFRIHHLSFLSNNNGVPCYSTGSK